MPGATNGVKTAISAAARAHEHEITDLSLRIHAHPELGHQEHRAVAWCREVLERHGFECAGVPGVETAFVATRRGAGDGPTIGFLAEYDALPGVDHGCGHNLIAGSAVGAGVYLARAMADLPGAVKVYGCPAEELGSGKPLMLAAGAFDGLDAALTFHAFHSTALMEQCTGVRMYEFEFAGRTAHAAADQHTGASALDGVLLTYNNLNALRQFVQDGVRIHGIVSDGGQAVNVIPERAACTLGIRSADLAELARVCARVIECARAGALASGTTLTVHDGLVLDPVRYNPPLGDALAANLRALGEPVTTWRSMASTDFGNVSQVVPSVLFSVATWPAEVNFHTREAAVCAARPQALRAMHTAAVAMAQTAADLLTHPGLLARIRGHHDRPA
ncbi:MAG: M20 family metallopeptidase [Armatimonadota bacterium]|nr:M20 family metallopeptidase [Armatimonadota bacterium]